MTAVLCIAEEMGVDITEPGAVEKLEKEGKLDSKSYS